MKLRLAVMVLACWVVAYFSAAAGAQTKKSAADALRAADQAWLKVFAAKDLEKSVAFCADDGAVLGQNAPIARGKKDIQDSFAGLFALPNMKISWQPDRVEVARSGELGYTSGTYQMTFTDPNGKTVPDKGKYVTVWKKQADRSWKVLLDIFNTDLPAPEMK